MYIYIYIYKSDSDSLVTHSGGSYGMMSASWDPDKEGSALGAEEPRWSIETLDKVVEQCRTYYIYIYKYDYIDKWEM